METEKNKRYVSSRPKYYVVQQSVGSVLKTTNITSCSSLLALYWKLQTLRRAAVCWLCTENYKHYVVQQSVGSVLKTTNITSCSSLLALYWKLQTLRRAAVCWLCTENYKHYVVQQSVGSVLKTTKLQRYKAKRKFGFVIQNYITSVSITFVTRKGIITRSLSTQHTSAYLSIPQYTSAYLSIPQHTSAYHSIPQHTSAFLSIS